MSLKKQQKMVTKDNSPFKKAFEEHKKGNLKEAESLYNKILENSPEHIGTLNNLGEILASKKKWLAAAELFYKIINIEPNNSGACNNLGIALKNQGLIDEAEVLFKKAIELKPDYIAAHASLGSLIVYKAIYDYTQGDFNSAATKINQVSNILNSPLKIDLPQATRIYLKYVYELLQNINSNAYLYNGTHEDLLYIIGESHCLSPSHTIIPFNGKNYKCTPHIVFGGKSWHIGDSEENHYKKDLRKIISNIPENSTTVSIFGEIDCRYNEGIYKYYRENPDTDLEQHIIMMVDNYVKYVLSLTSTRNITLLFCGVPASNIETGSLPDEDLKLMLNIIEIYNISLEEAAKQNNCQFVDVYSMTKGSDRKALDGWHIDKYHLTPSSFAKAIDESIK